MSTARRILSSTVLITFAAALCSAQNIAPSRSGTVQYFDGSVTIDGVALVSQTARFSELKEKSVLHTGLGRAEIMLTPGVFLRVAENSSVRMIDSRLISTRVELISGSAMLESDDPGTSVKDPAVTIIYKNFEAQAVKLAAFEITSDPGQVRVFKGEARVAGNGTSVNVKDGNLINLNTTMATARFDVKAIDDLYVWSRDRSAYLSAASMSSAKSLGSAFAMGNSAWNPNNMYGGFTGGWYYNRYLGMYTFMPFGGTILSPFGYGIYNPATIYYAYDPSFYWGGSGGARTAATTGVPLTRMVNVSASGDTRTQLPRLNYAANLHPTLTSPTRGLEPVMISAPLDSRGNNNGIFGAAMPQAINNSVPTGLSSVNNVSAPAMSAPAMSAPAPAMSAPAASSAAPAVGVRR